MDVDSCMKELIEIGPFDNDKNCDVTVNPCHVKVCMKFNLYLWHA